MKPQEKPAVDNQVSSEENVARILSKEWFVRGKLTSVAFALEQGESYLSVNRTAIRYLHPYSR